MYTRRLFAYWAAAVLALTTTQAWAIEYQILSTTNSSARVAFAFGSSPSRTSNSNTRAFAVATLPGVSVSVELTELRGPPCQSARISPTISGWMGADYLQWFIWDAVPARDNIIKAWTGILSVSFDRPVLVPSTRTVSCRNCFIRPPLIAATAKRATPLLSAMPFTFGLRMEVPIDGIYRLTGSDLAGLGVPIHTTPSRLYKLYCGATEVPVRITNSHRTHMDDDDEILFYGEHLRGENRHFAQFSNDNVYWLTWHPGTAGTRILEVLLNAVREGTILDTGSYLGENLAREYPDTIHIEEDNDIRWLGNVENPEEMTDAPSSETAFDNWYWGFTSSEDVTQYTFELASRTTDTRQNARLCIGLTGLSSVSDDPQDHQHEVLLNGHRLEPTAVWDGQTDYVHSSDEFPIAWLNHGLNTLMLERQSSRDRVALNWLDIELTRDFRSFNDQLHFRNHPSDINRVIEFQLTGFTTVDVDLWDIQTHRVFTGYDSRQENEAFAIMLQDSISRTTRYLAQTKSHRLRPANMVLDTLVEDWQFPEGVDYIIVTQHDFMQSLEPLAAAHEQNGLRVVLLDLQDIYNRFAYGLHDPSSIQSMLRYIVAAHPRDPPRYLLLAGDTSHDMDKQRKELNIVPTHLTRVPGWGPAADDGFFASVRGNDNFPDLAVGRLPARNSHDLEIMVTKTVNYLLYPERGYWHDNLVLAGGKEVDFMIFNDDAMHTIIGPKMNVWRLDAHEHSPYYTSGADAAGKLAGYINAGAYAVNFIGHGGGNRWSDSRMFSYDDLFLLHNSQWGRGGRLPIVFSLTCLTGFFESVFYKSLGEEFLRSGPDGAIAFYGASAYTRRSLDIPMNETLLQNAVDGTYESLGELLQVTEAMMLASHGAEAIPLVKQYNLLGDPALPWHLVPDSLVLTLDDTTLSGRDTLEISGSTAPVRSGKVRVRVSADRSPAAWHEQTLSVSNGAFTQEVVVKESASISNGVVRAFAWSDSAEVRGWVHFSKDTVLLHNVRISPELPGFGDSVTIWCQISLQDTSYEPGRLQCRYDITRAPQLLDFERYSPVLMALDSQSGHWVSERPIFLPLAEESPDTRKNLFLQFYETGQLQSSELFSFGLMERPDLVFTGDGLRVAWSGDSLFATCEVLNQGNAPAPPFTLALVWAATGDTIRYVTSADSVMPGQTVTFSLSLPDTNGNLVVSCIINPAHDFSEVLTLNNTASTQFSLVYADLQEPADSLYSPGRGLCIVSTKLLRPARRVFLFTDSIESPKPLPSASKWVPLRGDGCTQFCIATRPSLNASDSLAWIFFAENRADIVGPLAKKLGDTPRTSVFALDTANGQWSFRTAEVDTAGATAVHVTCATGPHALAKLMDNTPPDIRVFVAGRELLFLDYAARGRSLDIFLTDSSGVVPSSIELLLNGVPLEGDLRSVAQENDDPTMVTVTAYPHKVNTIDSLSVSAEDYAGNRGSKIFAYMPGEKLRIRFLSCHPNPFTATNGQRIRFAYLLTDVATTVRLSIYTIGGRPVWRSERLANRIGYQEIEWYGRDKHNHRIANGTYYSKLEVWGGSTKAERIIRIAKIEGY